MINIFIPFLTIFIIGYGLIKKIDIYNSFINGVKEGIHLVSKLFPTIFSISIAINIFLNSNILLYLCSYLFKYTLPKELLFLIFIKPISSSSCISILENIFLNYGVDSRYGIISSLIFSTTDTIIYLFSIYLSSVNIKKTSYLFYLCFLIYILNIIIIFILIK